VQVFQSGLETKLSSEILCGYKSLQPVVDWSCIGWVYQQCLKMPCSDVQQLHTEQSKAKDYWQSESGIHFEPDVVFAISEQNNQPPQAPLTQKQGYVIRSTFYELEDERIGVSTEYIF